MTQPTPTLPTRLSRRLRQAASRGLLLSLAAALACAAQTTELADRPLFATVSVPGNLLLSLSVEYPTASTPAYLSTSAYDVSRIYYGYFDPAKCYRYNHVNTGTSFAPNYSTSYFEPKEITSTRTCVSNASQSRWSGNYLNWATTQTIDAFRWAMTGGHRSVDTTSSTIIDKTYHAGYASHAWDYPDKALTSGTSGATPFNWANVTTRVWAGGLKMWVTGTNANISTDVTPPSGAEPYQGHNSYQSLFSSLLARQGDIYELYVRIKVCDSTVGLESNCVQYGSTAAKPEGLIQKYASKLRYSAFGYLTDDSNLRDGGVMRARMKYVGPTQPVPGSSAITNSATEWNATTGILVGNPDSADVTSTNSAAVSQSGYNPGISRSGVINYLNQFGLATYQLKSLDPVSELYYAGLRYFSNLGNVPEYSSLAGAGNLATMQRWVDGFPVIQTWDDPIVYSCQKNFVLGIGDVNSWQDANLPGSTIRTSEPTTPSAVSTDSSVNVKTATDMVGQLEGISDLGSYSSGRYNSFFIAGLAYDAHTRDLRSDLTGKQTVSTYWVDVLEGQYYQPKNQYWLAAKYGGFEVPSSFEPYATTNGSSTLSLSSWYNSSDLVGTDRRPDNYFTGAQADTMLNGLTSAFEKIVGETERATTTAFSSTSPNETSTGSTSYQTSYDPATWSANLQAVSTSYSTTGTITATPLWEASAVLDAMATSDRKIVTHNGTTALEFTHAAMTTSASTQLATFGAVTGATSQSTANFLNYLRGDRSQERANGGPYRSRASRLGDIVNSKLTAVGAPDASYYDNTNPGYSAFKRARASRQVVVYAGSNDGMMHAFDGRASGSNAGKELFAFIPSYVYGSSTTAPTTGLAALGNPNYTHRYYVDATPQVYDVDFNRSGTATAASTSDWRSMLIGGLGKGGKGYYAIDVSNPTDWTTQTAMVSKVKWQFTDSDMGYSYGDARVVKTAKYGWVAVLTSGYGNGTGRGYIYFVNPSTGALLEKVVTPTGYGSSTAPLDLAHVNAFIPDITDYTATALYAGDMRGNLWRYDLTGTTGDYPQPIRLATLANASGSAQPVTTPPRIMVDPTTGKRYVMVGTGRLLADSDIKSTQAQSFYAIIDGDVDNFYTTSTLPTGASFPVTRSQLSANTDLLTGIGSSPSGPMGWYLDLAVNTTSGIAERINVAPTVNNGVVGVAVNLPNGDVCTPTGSSYIFAVSFATGRSVLTNSTGTLIATTSSASGIVTDLAFKSSGGKVRLVGGRSDGTVTSLPGTYSSSDGVRRLNWREVPTLN
ncbi:type IV pilus assembly protein PilY1 [Sphaerotilus hippei]|uniref:Type IV pilus assembly protein PilY1 n=1 Tax=Sphaerotilus hippei TaxID=744406 RepID=A0A318H0Y6_9BURK|nr:PilC/PilY family type IV pilus protein [Sphaerotilus hippei]PXW96258.1 type IV pilus assembly protein PilY1 [Sphaerotilus hippei]